MKKEIEILAPAGSMDSLKAAIHAGADAVYMGGMKFGARAFADNPDEDMMKYAIDYVHLHDKKLYMTVNTLLKDQELSEELIPYMTPYYEEGLDGVIVQDPGVAAVLREAFPNLHLHASTQMSVTGADTAAWLLDQGFSRVVLARELSLDEIREIYTKTRAELEIFVQGALCYCYSGQCLLSSMIGGRSGNRGRCAQPCRLPYSTKDMKNGAYLMSPKDICTLKMLPDLIEAGGYSFKIEGRMKKPEYAAFTSFIYRKYADLYLDQGRQGYHVDEKDIEALADLYNRGGFTEGYLKKHNGREMMSVIRPNHMGVACGKVDAKGKLRLTRDLHPQDVMELRNVNDQIKGSMTVGKGAKAGESFTALRGSKGDVLYRMRDNQLIDQIHRDFLGEEKKEKIDGLLTVIADEPASLTLYAGEISVTVSGEIVQRAKQSGMSEEALLKPVKKTGATAYAFDHLDVITDGSSFMPNSQLNDLRRRALDALDAEKLAGFRRRTAINSAAYDNVIDGALTDPTAMKLSVMFTGKQMYAKAEITAAYPEVARVYLELHEAACDGFKLARRLKSKGKEIVFALPQIIRAKDRAGLLEDLAAGRDVCDGLLVRQMEGLLLARRFDETIPVITDYSLYAMNQAAAAVYKAEGVSQITAPVELNAKELARLGLTDKELIIYGHQLLMTSAQCITQTTKGCSKQPMMIELTDRQHKHFYAYNDCRYCYNKIYNGMPTMLFHQQKQIKNLAPASVRVHFVKEDEGTIRSVLDAACAFVQGEAVTEPSLKSFTRGHFNRGID